MKATEYSSVLSDQVDDYRPVALARDGALVKTSSNSILEVAGGSHATCIVNDNKEIQQRISQKVLSGELFVGSGRKYSNHQQLLLAEKITKLAGHENDKVFFTSGGTESFETSLRLALHVQLKRGKPSKSFVVGHDYSYYGMSLAARNASSHPEHSKMASSLDYNWPKLPLPLKKNIGQMENILSCHSDLIAAVIIEPVSGTTGGAIVADIQYMNRLREKCREINAILIVDETVTAFGRTGESLLSTGYRPDIIFGGKCLAGSFAPISAVLVSDDLCSELRCIGKNLPLRLTFSGNSLACGIANIVQDYISEKKLYSAVKRNHTLIENFLSSAIVKIPGEAWISGVGHHWAIHKTSMLENLNHELLSLKSVSTQVGVEFMGGSKVVSEQASVHMMITPAFDLTEMQIEEILSSAVNVFTQTYK